MESFEVVERDFVQWQFEDTHKHLFGFRTLHCDFSIIVAFIFDLNIETSCIFFNPGNIFVNVCRIDNQEILLVIYLIYKQVVYSAAVLIAHHAIEYLSVGCACNVVDKYVAYIFIRVFAFYTYLAHMAHIKYTHVVTYGVVLFYDGGILNRHVEASERGHKCTLLHMTVMKTSFNQILFHYNRFKIYLVLMVVANLTLHGFCLNFKSWLAQNFM